MSVTKYRPDCDVRSAQKNQTLEHYSKLIDTTEASDDWRRLDHINREDHGSPPTQKVVRRQHLQAISSNWFDKTCVAKSLSWAGRIGEATRRDLYTKRIRGVTEAGEWPGDDEEK